MAVYINIHITTWRSCPKQDPWLCVPTSLWCLPSKSRY